MPRSLVVVTSVNGCTLPLERKSTGFICLLSMKERVELVGGTVNIESAIGRGTRLYVVIPLAGDDRVEG